MALSDYYKLIALPKIVDPRGNLSVCEAFGEVPFDIKRVYWTYEVPEGKDRGAHAHKNLRQLIIAMHGSFSVTLDNGEEKHTVELSHPWEGLLLEPGIWRTLDYFSDGAVCVVFASEHYDESDYIRSYDEFLAWRGGCFLEERGERKEE